MNRKNKFTTRWHCLSRLNVILEHLEPEETEELDNLVPHFIKE